MDIPNDLGIPWDRPIFCKSGCGARLSCITVYTDFPWKDLAPHGMRQFPHGQHLTARVKKDAGDRRPVLLLTNRTGGFTSPILTAKDYIVVFPIQDLSELEADEIDTYYARQADQPVSGLPALTTLPAEQIDAFLTLNIDRIGQWIIEKPERLAQIRAIARELRSTDPLLGIDIDHALSLLSSLETVDPILAEQLAAILTKAGNSEGIRQALLTITANVEWLEKAGEVFIERLPERISAARKVAEKYAELLKNPTAGETPLQDFIQKHGWLFGLEYVRVRPKQGALVGAMDFLLERFDGFHDLLELKDPRDPIIVAPDYGEGEKPPPPSEYAVSATLANALAQSLLYKDRMTRHAEAMEDLMGIRHSREPRVLIIAGQRGNMTSHRQRALDQLNLSLHRVEIVPYDILGKRALALIENIEHMPED